MRFLKWTAGAVLVCASLGSASVAANAATSSDCISMARTVAAAFDAGKNPDKLDAARRQQSEGRSLCDAGMYAGGVARYQQALRLLGADDQGQVGTTAPPAHSDDD